MIRVSRVRAPFLRAFVDNFGGYFSRLLLLSLALFLALVIDCRVGGPTGLITVGIQVFAGIVEGLRVAVSG